MADSKRKDLDDTDASEPALHSTKKRHTKQGTRFVDNSVIRAENEDDDGYDPYSDRIVKEPFFERDPWD